MRVVHSYIEFLKLVIPLRFDDFDDLNIIPTTESGLFLVDRFNELVNFCKTNSQYHVATQVGFGVSFNKPVPNGQVYKLCKGDSDPELTYIDQIGWEGYECLKILKFNIDKI